MKIVQISSFNGNLGDNFSHFGFQQLWSQSGNNDYYIDELEIRRTYLNYNFEDSLSLDVKFSNKLNKETDLLVIGGGCFLEPMEDTQSGFRLDFDPNFFKNLEIPILFSSIGAKPRTAEKITLPDIQNLLGSRSKTKILLRNDGSFEWFNKAFGENAAVEQVCDSAFFAFDEIKKIEANNCRENYILLNVGQDQLLTLGPQKYSNYLRSLAIILSKLMAERQLNLKCVAHTPYDIQAYAELLDYFDDWVARSKISIVQFDPGIEGLNSLFKSYACASMNITMRFHANILASMLDAPHISIGVLERTKNVMNSIGADYLNLDPLDTEHNATLATYYTKTEGDKSRQFERIADLIETSNTKYTSFFSEIT